MFWYMATNGLNSHSKPKRIHQTHYNLNTGSTNTANTTLDQSTGSTELQRHGIGCSNAIDILRAFQQKQLLRHGSIMTVTVLGVNLMQKKFNLC